MVRTLPLLALLVLAPALAAQSAAPVPATPAAPPPLKRVEFTGDLSYVSTGGNTQVTTTGAGDKLVLRASRRWSFTQYAGVIYGRNDGTVNAESYRAGLRTDYSFSNKTGAYALLAFDRDRFSGVAARYQYSAGLAAKPWDTADNSLKVEAGTARINQRATDDRITRTFSGRTAGVYRHNFGTKTYFEQGAEVLVNFRETDDTQLNSLSTLVAPISAHIGLKTAYTVKFDNQPSPGFRKTDTTLTTGLQVTF